MPSAPSRACPGDPGRATRSYSRGRRAWRRPRFPSGAPARGRIRPTCSGSSRSPRGHPSPCSANTACAARPGPGDCRAPSRARPSRPRWPGRASAVSRCRGWPAWARAPRAWRDPRPRRSACAGSPPGHPSVSRARRASPARRVPRRRSPHARSPSATTRWTPRLSSASPWRAWPPRPTGAPARSGRRCAPPPGAAPRASAPSRVAFRTSASGTGWPRHSSGRFPGWLRST